MNKKILIGVAALAAIGFIAYSMKAGATQQVNTTAANTSGSASAVLSGLLSGWANPSSVIPAPAVVASNGTVATPAPAPAPTVAAPLVVIGGTEYAQDTPTMKGDELARWEAVQPAMKKLFAGWGQ